MFAELSNSFILENEKVEKISPRTNVSAPVLEEDSDGQSQEWQEVSSKGLRNHASKANSQAEKEVKVVKKVKEDKKSSASETLPKARIVIFVFPFWRFGDVYCFRQLSRCSLMKRRDRQR